MCPQIQTHLRGITVIKSKKGASPSHCVFFHLSRDSSVDDENSGESPLISIWGEYTGLCSLCVHQWILGISV